MDNITAHFVRMVAAINMPSRIQEPIPTTIEGLAAILCCTPRNVKFILRKLEEQAFIEWQPGRGRGHTSQLTFLRSVEEVLEDSFQDLISKGKIKDAIELIGNIEVNEALKERLLTLLNKQMGFRGETETTSGLDVLRITRNRHMEKLDPALVYTAFESYLLGHICSTLVSYDAASRTFLPGLAHMWEANEEHTRYTFYLRKGVRFHHGRSMTSRDVKETLQRLTDLNSPALYHYRDIAAVELEGDHRIRFELHRPNLFFLHLFSCIHMSIVPFDVDFAHGAVGTGPYQLTDLNEDVLVLTAFDYYYGIRPLLDRVEIWYLPELGTNERQYQLPDVNQENLTPNECYNNSIDYPALGCRYILFNFRKKGIHHHIAFRQVLRILYNQVALVRELGGNRITPADSLLPWNSSQRQWVEPSFERIKALLRECGYKGESVTIAYMAKKEEQEEAEWLQTRGALVGLRIELHPLTEYNQENIQNNADLLIAEEVLEDDWQWGMINYFRNESTSLYFLLQDSQRAVLYHELEHFSQLPREERGELLNKAEEVLRDNYWVLHGCHINKRVQLNQSLFGLHTGSFGFLDISKLWIKTGLQKDNTPN